MNSILSLLLLISLSLPALCEETPSFNLKSCPCNTSCFDLGRSSCIRSNQPSHFKESDSLIVHLRTDSISQKRMDALHRLLQEDGFRILYCETSPYGWSHAIVVTPVTFRAVFSGELFPGINPLIKGVKLPKRYTPYINTIHFPDPKFGISIYFCAKEFENRPFTIYAE